MSKARQTNGDDWPEAAEKHLADAKTLQSANRYDGAAYLTGYIVECCLKTLLWAEGTPVRSLWHHRINELSSGALTFGLTIGTVTSRYFPCISPTHPLYSYGTPNGWRETMRYEAPGMVSSSTLQSWLLEAEQLFSATIPNMKLDGVI